MKEKKRGAQVEAGSSRKDSVVKQGWARDGLCPTFPTALSRGALVFHYFGPGTRDVEPCGTFRSGCGKWLFYGRELKAETDLDLRGLYCRGCRRAIHRYRTKLAREEARIKAEISEALELFDE